MDCAYADRNLVMVYESEATAVAVVKQHLRVCPVAEGKTFIVVDAGAGTVDITSHQVCCTYHMLEQKKKSLRHEAFQWQICLAASHVR